MKIDKTEGDVNLSEERQKWYDDYLGEESKALIDEDARYFLHQSLSTPCINILDSCSESFIYDLEGRSYLDFHGNNLHQVGYKNKFVVDAIKAQLDQLSFCPRRYTNRPAIELAKKLTQLTPGDLNRVLLAPGGTSAIGMALKLARAVTGKFKTISWWDSFHGASLDAISVGGEAQFRNGIGPLLPGAIQIPPPLSYRPPFGTDINKIYQSTDYLNYVMEHEGDIAAFIAEPIRNTNCTIPPKNYWKEVREICDKHNALLIFDEIPTCLGRTGKMFACENFDVVPDILCIGKGLGGGIFPLAAILTKDKYNIAAAKSLGHYTHEKNPVGAAAAIATLNFIENENLLERTVGLGERFIYLLNELKNKHKIIGDVRGVGLLLAVELVKDRVTKEPAVYEAEKVMYECLMNGLSFKVSSGNVLTLMPPLTITDEEVIQSIDILDKSLYTINI